MDMELAGEKILLQLNDLDEFRMNVYENSKLYKEKTKWWHNKHIKHLHFVLDQLVLLYASRLKFFPGKLKSRWSGPFKIVCVTPYKAIKLRVPNSERTFSINGQRIKHYWGGDVDRHKSSIALKDA
nr:PREDICTED: uncharacterized protein LOC104243067 [Nicotiana sylvestris]XP_016456006.1 PREDICTED: uncharacterized protein LOC107780012 [Nicotiana tabacum]